MILALLVGENVHILGHLQKKSSQHFFVVPHKSYFVCPPEMEDIGEKQPISAFKVAESMFFLFFSSDFLSCCRKTVQTS